MNDLPTPPKLINDFLQKITLPQPGSHKGQNGKLLLIGGSELFHAASKWSLDVASKFVDMVFYCSEPSNNQLIQEAKGKFWNGIVIDRSDIENYIEEADCVLIGPGMTRTSDTTEIVNQLLKKYPHKKWVVDAGALQMANPDLLGATAIITPHQRELQLLIEHGFEAKKFAGVMVLKGEIDTISTGSEEKSEQKIEISGGSVGMTKGGTGDVLAGLIAALYCTNQATPAAVAGSFLNKKAGELLFAEVGPFFNASNLVATIPKVAWHYLKSQS